MSEASTPPPPRTAPRRDAVRRWIEQTRELAELLHNEAPNEELSALRERLAASEDDRQLLMKQLVEMDRRLGRLVNLYVATYQLHASLDPAEVQNSLMDIALNIIGAEQFALLVRRDDTNDCDVVLAHGLDEIETAIFPPDGYSGGDPLVDATLADGLLRLAPIEGSCATAAVPLLVDNSVVGVLVIVRLFEHREALGQDDREVLDMLASHAGSALYAAQVVSTKEKQLQTLQSFLSGTRRNSIR